MLVRPSDSNTGNDVDEKSERRMIPSDEAKEVFCMAPEVIFPIPNEFPTLTVGVKILLFSSVDIMDIPPEDAPIIFEFTPFDKPGVGIIVPTEETLCEKGWF